MRRRPKTVVTAISLALVLSQFALMAVPAVIVDLAHLWSLNASEMGWLGGIYFLGYAVGLPFIGALAGRLDGRIVYAASVVVAGVASFAFAALAAGFWSALALRFVAGIGFSGIHIIGLKLIADRLEGAAQARAGAFYSAAYAIGSGASFLVAGLLAQRFGWPASFVAAGMGTLLALPLLLFVGAPLPGHELRAQRWLPDYGLALRSPQIRRFILAYAGNTWEVFAIRVWFVPALAFNASLPGHDSTGWNFSVLAGLSALAAVPVSIIVAELGIRFGRERIVRWVAFASAAVCLATGLLLTSNFYVVLALLFLHGVTSYGDAGAINGGLISASTPESRSAALTLFGLMGFLAGFLGPLAVGVAIDGAGGASSSGAWGLAFVVMGVGSVVAGIAMSGKTTSGRS
jgi:MFS family permease